MLRLPVPNVRSERGHADCYRRRWDTGAARLSHNGSVPAFQAGGVGSIPISRSRVGARPLGAEVPARLGETAPRNTGYGRPVPTLSWT